MLSRIEKLIEIHGMKPHPEGGWYKETYRSNLNLDTKKGERSLVTSILFLLTSENQSNFHSIKSDELWYFHEGNDFTVHVLQNKKYTILNLGKDSSAFGIVPANAIFGSTVSQGYALVSCVVSPGFDFADFKLYTADELIKDFPDSSEIIRRLTQ